MTQSEIYMQRCLQLAMLGKNRVAPNPMVGAVLMYNNKIIGEGYHENFGGAHAEVNCIHSVKNENVELIPKSTLYVSLEPCNHFGKTAPCVDVILQHKIKKVVVGCSDPFNKVNGKGIQRLRDNSVTVIENILEKDCIELNKRFFTFHKKKRPYIILKWAISKNGMLACENSKPIKISNEFSDRLVHKWRSEEDAILIGSQTALSDNPMLNNRLWVGKNPKRIIIDSDLKVNSTNNIFNQEQTTIVFNNIKSEVIGNTHLVKINSSKSVIQNILDFCFENNIQSIIIEGGAITHQHFIEENVWDEARIIQNQQLVINNGIESAQLKSAQFISSEKFLNDTISFYQNITTLE